jgi:excisionase family DNA binding protein
MSVAPQKRQWLSLADSSGYTGYSIKTIRRKIASGELRAYKLPHGRDIRVDQADLDALLQPIPTGGDAA